MRELVHITIDKDALTLKIPTEAFVKFAEGYGDGKVSNPKKFMKLLADELVDNDIEDALGRTINDNPRVFKENCYDEVDD